MSPVRVSTTLTGSADPIAEGFSLRQRIDGVSPWSCCGSRRPGEWLARSTRRVLRGFRVTQAGIVGGRGCRAVALPLGPSGGGRGDRGPARPPGGHRGEGRRNSRPERCERVEVVGGCGRKAVSAGGVAVRGVGDIALRSGHHGFADECTVGGGVRGVTNRPRGFRFSDFPPVQLGRRSR